MKKELGRQAFHALLGICLIAFLFIFGRQYLIYLLSAILVLGSIIINWKYLGSKVYFANWFEKKFERDETRFPGYGSAWYVVGALMLALFLQNTNEVAAGLFVLGVGDAASTVFGLKGKYKIPYNPHKTLEGSAAFFVFSLISYFFIGWLAIPLALICAIAESLPLPYDDNITIPAATVIFFFLV